MGVGKTLSMIASIVHDIPSSHTPLADDKSNQNGLMLTSLPLIPATSTLVIVPSVCEFFAQARCISFIDQIQVLLEGWIDEVKK
jgi:hypothetical protein